MALSTAGRFEHGSRVIRSVGDWLSYLCKQALERIIHRFVKRKRIINCTPAINCTLFENTVLSLDVEILYTWGQVAELKILHLLLRLALQGLKRQGICMLNVQWGYGLFNFEQGKSEGFDSCDRPSNLKLD